MASSRPRASRPQTPQPLQDQLLQAIALRGGVRHYPARAVLVTEEDPGDALYIVLHGRLKVYGAGPDGREIVYSTMSRGEYFGEMSLDGGPRSASVMTLEPSSCAVVPGAEVRDFLASHPDFALHLVHKLIKLARASTGQVKSLALDDVYGRVVQLLQRLAVAAPGLPPGVQVVPERLTQQDIAERVGSSREMVGRVLKPLIDGGSLAVRDGHFLVLQSLPSRP